MKRKALLMGMAVMASFPGWALAKGGSKADRAQHPYSSVWEVPEGSEPEDLNMRAASRAGELLAQIKDTLRRTNYGAPALPTAQDGGWKMEVLDVGAGLGYADDAPPQPGRPVGVSFHLSF